MQAIEYLGVSWEAQESGEIMYMLYSDNYKVIAAISSS